MKERNFILFWCLRFFKGQDFKKPQQHSLLGQVDCNFCSTQLGQILPQLVPPTHGINAYHLELHSFLSSSVWAFLPTLSFQCKFLVSSETFRTQADLLPCSGRIRWGIHTKKWQQGNQLPKHLASLCFFLLIVYLKTMFLTKFGLLRRLHHLRRSFFSLIFSIFLPCNKIGFHTT